MNPNDFRYMLRGKPLADLKKEDCSLLKPIDHQGSKKKCALLLLHGFTSSPAVYRCLIPQLKKYDALVCPVLPGHAESIETFSKTKSGDWLRFAMQHGDSLFKEYQKVDILGLSLGALLACQLSQHFQFNHMFLLAPALKLKMDINKNAKLLKLLRTFGFCELRNKAGDMCSDLHAEISLRRLPVSPVIELFTLIHEYQWVAPSCPLDLFLGAYDRVVDSEHVEKMFSNLPNATIHWLANSAHVLPLDNDLNQIVECINQRK